MIEPITDHAEAITLAPGSRPLYLRSGRLQPGDQAQSLVRISALNEQHRREGEPMVGEIQSWN